MENCTQCGGIMKVQKKLKMGGKALVRMKCACGHEETVRSSSSEKEREMVQERELKALLKEEKLRDKQERLTGE